MNRILILIGALGLLLAMEPRLLAGSSNKKKDQFTIRIHGEGSSEDGEKFVIPVELLDGRKAHLSIMPLLTEHEVKSVYPFKSPDGSGGAYLRLDGHGSNLLTQYSMEKRGSVLAVMVNGRQAVDVLVDAPVKDGLFVIPRGLTMADEARLVNGFPLMGQENSPSQKKKKQPFSPTDIMIPPKASDLRNASAQPATTTAP
ncbi:MAG: hypothetical protein ACOYMT_05045 [Chthoniobacterales bacterium]